MSKNSRKSAEQTSQQIAQANELLSNLQTEIQIVQGKQRQLQADLKAATEKELTRRRAELKQLQKEAQDELELAKTALKEAAGLVRGLEYKRDSLEAEVLAQLAELERYRESIGDVKKEAETEKATLEKLRSKQHGLSEALTTLRSQSSALQETAHALKGEIKELEIAKESLALAITHTHENFKTDKAEQERQIKALEVRKTNLFSQIQEDEKTWEAVRQDLAKRQLALDERDKVLRRREHKVERDESIIRQNAGLLNL